MRPAVNLVEVEGVEPYAVLLARQTDRPAAYPHSPYRAKWYWCVESNH